MEYITVNMRVPKEASEVIDSVIEMVSAVKAAGADGLGIDDLPALTAAAITVASEVSDYDQIVTEIRTDPEAAANLAALTGARFLKALGLL